jgi:hypothetical protein
MEMTSNKAVYGLTILEPPQQSRKAIRLIVQWEHHFMNNRQSRAACFGKHSSLRDTILEQRQYFRLRSIGPKILHYRVRVCLSGIQMSIHLS